LPPETRLPCGPLGSRHTLHLLSTCLTSEAFASLSSSMFARSVSFNNKTETPIEQRSEPRFRKMRFPAAPRQPHHPSISSSLADSGMFSRASYLGNRVCFLSQSRDCLLVRGAGLLGRHP